VGTRMATCRYRVGSSQTEPVGFIPSASGIGSGPRASSSGHGGGDTDGGSETSFDAQPSLASPVSANPSDPLSTLAGKSASS
jgi:hypothetical protein